MQYLKTGIGAVTGKLKEIQYTPDFSEVIKVIPDRFNVLKLEKIYASGGCFLVTRNAALKTGYFDERLERSQDYDYTLRLTLSFPMIAIPSNMGIHHTVGYEERGRFISQIKKFHALYYGTVIRKNLRNFKGVMWLMIKKEHGILLGGSLMLLGFIAIYMFGKIGAAFFCLLFFSDIFVGIAKERDILYRMYLHYLFPLLILLGCFYTLDRRSQFKVEEV